VPQFFQGIIDFTESIVLHGGLNVVPGCKVQHGGDGRRTILTGIFHFLSIGWLQPPCTSVY
jgi:hypothetical protein